eukprot:GEMP01017932.1.p1 GENE.GEMP01017932.1~~GEMP01017932.1.p1  ORF type:complete len:273 (+),score=50.22 GEMP01017932.1:125-943(+)
MTTTLYVQNIPITLPGGTGGRARIEDAIHETLQAMGIMTPCLHVRNMKGDRLRTSLAIPGETYVADWPGCNWRETVANIKREARKSASRARSKDRSGSRDGIDLQPDLDLPPTVIRSIAQLNDSELRPSIFGGCSGAALLRARVVEQKHLHDLAWVKSELHNGIHFSKCARKNSQIAPRTLSSNQTFTVFFIKGGRQLKKIAVSEIRAIINGKASPELENTSSSISPYNCLCLQTEFRYYSMIFPTSEDRGRLANALEFLLSKEVIDQDNIL